MHFPLSCTLSSDRNSTYFTKYSFYNVMQKFAVKTVQYTKGLKDVLMQDSIVSSHIQI